MFGLSKKERNIKASRKYLESLSKSFENREIHRDDAISIILIATNEIDSINTRNHKEDLSDYLVEKIEKRFNADFEAIEALKNIIAGLTKKDIKEIKKDGRPYKHMPTYYEDLLENTASLLFADKFFKKDCSDLIISQLVEYLVQKYCPYSGLLGDTFHDTFLTTGPARKIFSFDGVALYLKAFAKWEKIDRNGYHIEGELECYKIPRFIREYRIKEKISDYHETKSFNGALK